MENQLCSNLIPCLAKSGQAIKNPYFILKFKPSKEFCYQVIVAKSQYRTQIEKNRIERRIKELIRKSKDKYQIKLDCLFLASNRVLKVSPQLLKQEVEQTLKHLENISKEL